MYQIKNSDSYPTVNSRYLKHCYSCSLRHGVHILVHIIGSIIFNVDLGGLSGWNVRSKYKVGLYVCINYKPGNGIKMLCGAKKKKESSLAF